MILVLLIVRLLTFTATAPVSNETSKSPERELQKSLVRNLRSRYSGTEMPKTMTRTFDLTDRASNQSQGGIHDIPPEVKGYIISFLSPKDLLNANLVNPLYYNLSNQVIYLSLTNQNPNFVLEENWMNMALSDFLQKYFEKGILNMDDLLMTVYAIVIRPKEEHQYPGVGTMTLRLLAFVYEFQNGPNSHLPYLMIDFFVDVLRKSVKRSLPKFLKVMESYLRGYAKNNGHDVEQYMKYIEDLFQFLATNPTVEQIMVYIKFDPAQPIMNSGFIKFPSFMKIAICDIILPLCEDAERFNEAIDKIYTCYAFSQTLFDQVDFKFPHMFSKIRMRRGNFPSIRKALIKRFPKTEIIGLDYLVTRNSSNPFNLKQLQNMEPNYEILIKEFAQVFTGTLIESDIITQMKEAGLFKEIQKRPLLNMIDSLLSSKNRPELEIK